MFASNTRLNTFNTGAASPECSRIGLTRQEIPIAPTLLAAACISFTKPLDGLCLSHRGSMFTAESSYNISAHVQHHPPPSWLQQFSPALQRCSPELTPEHTAHG